MFFPALFFLLLGCICSWLVIHFCLLAGIGQGEGKERQHHHTHTGVVPRIGGVGVMCGFALTCLLYFLNLDDGGHQALIHYAVLVGGVATFLLGLVDDFRPLGAKTKLLVQVVIATGAHYAGLSIDVITIPFTGISTDIGFVSLIVTVIWIVAMINLINLIDGLDGLAGGIGLMLMCLLSYLAFERGVVFSLILSLGMVGAIMGFLFHNFPPAKAYLGDSGAYLIGFVIAVLSLINSEKGAVLAALIAPVLALALPIADVAFAIIRRGVKGLPLFRPDKGHIHHRLIRSGISSTNTVLVLYAISLFALIGGLLVFADQGRFLAIFLGFAFVVILFSLRGMKIATVDNFRLYLTESLQARQDTRNALTLKDWFLIEIERVDTGENLWSDFTFILKKVGFCRAEIRINDASRVFVEPNSVSDQSELIWDKVYSFGNGDGTLTLCAEKDLFSSRQFELVCDIANETWCKSIIKWQQLNDEPYDFNSKAIEPSDYKDQKSRNLYRPTY